LRSKRGHAYHRLYVWMKVPQSLLMAANWYWIWKTVELDADATLGLSDAFGVSVDFILPLVRTLMLLGGVALSLVGLVYPIVLFFFLHSAGVRNYYSR